MCVVRNTRGLWLSRLEGALLTHYVTVTCDLTCEAFDGSGHLIYLATSAWSTKLSKARRVPDLKTTTPVLPMSATSERNCQDLAQGQLIPWRTGELGLRITWNFWRNDKYPDVFLALCELCGYVVKIFSDQHRRWLGRGTGLILSPRAPRHQRLNVSQRTCVDLARS